jgi:hypothetical protein
MASFLQMHDTPPAGRRKKQKQKIPNHRARLFADEEHGHWVGQQ